jgi:CheY-like chemotaxis protein
MIYKNILQFDDDSDDCELFMEALKAVSSAFCTSLSDPLEALRRLVEKEIQPDVTFLDLNMPIMSGMELLGELKKQELLKDIPVIIFLPLSLIVLKEKPKIRVRSILFPNPIILPS